MNQILFNRSREWSRWIIGSILLIGTSQAQLTMEGVNNPHGGQDCSVCHASDQTPGQKTIKQDVCLSCHSPEAVNALIHPIFDVNPRSEKLHIPSDFKLAPDGGLDCLTCHEVTCKIDRSNRSFLRHGPYRQEIDFCFNCHSALNYAQTNPHKQVLSDGEIDKSTCLQCHVKQPTKDDHVTIVREMQLDMAATCNKCHALHTHEQNHQGKNIELSKHATVKRFKETQKKFGIELPLSKDNLIQCNTCHYTHNRGTLGADQVVYEGDGENQRYLRLAREKLCYACHDL